MSEGFHASASARRWLAVGFRRALAESFVGNAVNLALFLGTQTLLARVLTVAEFGTFGALSGLGLFLLVATSPLASYAKHGLARSADPEAQKRLVAWTLRSFGWISFSAAAVFAAAFSWLRRSLEVEPAALAAFAFYALVTHLQSTMAACQQGLHRFLESAAYNGGVLAARAVALAGALAADRRMTAASAFLLYGASSLPASVVGFRSTLRSLGSKSPTKEGKSARADESLSGGGGDLSTLFPGAVAIVSITAFSTLDSLLAKSFLDARETGLYYAASSFGKLAFTLTLTFVDALLPIASRARALGVSASFELRLVLAGAAIVGIGVSAAVGLFPGATLGIAFGPEYSGSGSIAVVCAVAMTGASILSALFGYDLGRGDRRFVVPAAIGPIAMTSAIAFGSPRTAMDIAVGVAIGASASLFAFAAAKAAFPRKSG